MTILSKAYCQSIINGVNTLHNLEGKRIPEHLLKEDAKHIGKEFAPNSYLTVLKHLSMMKDYELDYYYYDSDSFPYLFARAKSSNSFSSIDECNLWYVDNSLRDYIVADEQMESYFEILVFEGLDWHADSDSKIVISEDWHAQYSNAKIVISEEDIKNIIKEFSGEKFVNYKKIIELFEKERKLELLPQVNIIDDKHVEITYYKFTKWGNFFLFKNKIIMMRTCPYKTVSFEQETVVEYNAEYKGIMMNFWGRLPSWAQIMLFLFLVVFIAPLIGEAFIAFPLVFLAILICTPVLLSILSGSNLTKWISPYEVYEIRAFSLAVSIIISVIFVFQFNDLLDRFSYMFVEGYKSYHYPDVDEYGGKIESVSFSTAHWYSGVLLWLGELGYLIFFVGVPYLTWLAGSRVVKSVEKAHNRNNLDDSNAGL